MRTRIIIVEDEGLIALDLKKRLELVGYEVPAVHDNVSEALESIELLQPALVLMDIRLRGPQDGIEAAEIIRRLVHIPVIYVTAHADPDTLQRARLTEPFGYIVKPFHLVDFRAQIEMAIWKHRMEQQLRASEAWLAATVRNIADAVIATDSAGNISLMNAPAEKLTGWAIEKAKGRALLDIFSVCESETGAPVIHPLKGIFEGHEPEGTPRRLLLRRRESADETLIEATISANRDAGLLLGVVIVFRRVQSAPRRQQEAARRTTRSRNSNHHHDQSLDGTLAGGRT